MIVTVSTSTALVAALKTAHAGDTIQLASGDYAQIGLSNVNFTGAGVTITSADASAQATLHGLSLTNSSGLTFSGLNMDFEPKVGAAVMLTSVTNVTLDKVNVYGDPTDLKANQSTNGVFIKSSTNVTVTNSNIHDVGAGVVHQNDSYLTISNNQIHDITLDGIRGGGSSNVTVTGNLLTNFHPQQAAHNDAIQFWTAGTTTVTHDITVTDNTIVRGTGDLVQGVFMANEAGITYQNVTIQDNAIEGMGYHGITLIQANNAHVDNNLVQGYTDFGAWIEVENSTNSTVNNNDATSYIITGNTNTTQTGDVTLKAAAVGDTSVATYWASNGELVPVSAIAPATGTSTVAATPGAIGAIDNIQSSDAVIVLGATTENLQLNGAIYQRGYGNALNNVITGNGSQDYLVGMDGDDTLVSNGGLESMSGGNGHDIFDFAKLPTGVDLIADFTKGDDKIDLHSLLTGYKGTDPIADGWVKFNADAAGTTVYVDQDGHGAADAFVAVAKLTGVTGLTVSDLAPNPSDSAAVVAAVAVAPVVVAPIVVAPVVAPIAAAAVIGAATSPTGAAATVAAAATPAASTVAGTVTAQAAGHVINGTAAADNIQGTAGADTINGHGGADVLAGGAGNDTYFVDDYTTSVSEQAGAGVDTVDASVDLYVLGANVENLVLTGAIYQRGYGNALNNVITGNGSQDYLVGMDGNDTLVSNGGQESMSGGVGHDVFDFAKLPKGTDIIADFTKGDDVIDLHSLLGAYKGTNPVADGWVKFTADATGTTVYVDQDGHGTAGGFVAIAKLTGFTGTLTAGADWIFH